MEWWEPFTPIHDPLHQLWNLFRPAWDPKRSGQTQFEHQKPAELYHYVEERWRQPGFGLDDQIIEWTVHNCITCKY